MLIHLKTKVYSRKEKCTKDEKEESDESTCSKWFRRFREENLISPKYNVLNSGPRPKTKNPRFA